MSMNRLLLPALLFVACMDSDLPAAAPAADAPSEASAPAAANPAPEDWRKPFGIADPCAFTEGGPNYCDRRTDTKSPGPIRCFETYEICSHEAWERAVRESFQRDLRDWLNAPPPDPCDKFATERPHKLLSAISTSPCRPTEDGRWAINSGFLSVYTTLDSCEEGQHLQRTHLVSYEIYPAYLEWQEKRTSGQWESSRGIWGDRP